MSIWRIKKKDKNATGERGSFSNEQNRILKKLAFDVAALLKPLCLCPGVAVAACRVMGFQLNVLKKPVPIT